MEAVCRHTKKQKTITKGHFFLMEKCFEDLRQDEKHVPDLLEWRIQLNLFVKDELRQKLFEMTEFTPEITKIRVCNFQMSGKIPDLANVAFEAVILTPFLQYLAALAAKYSKKCRF